ncbi:MAG: CMP deaminase, partial [Hymenobacter sp.]
TLYTTLEPCVKLQQGQIRESCADLIIRSGITKTIIGVLEGVG